MSGNPMLNKLVKDLGCGNRAVNALDKASIQTIGQLIQNDAYDLLDIRWFGQDCLIRVTDSLAEMGLALKSSNFKFRA